MCSDRDGALAGWTRLASSDELVAEKVFSADEHDVVVWRAADDTVIVMESRCPHQWSHLGAVGVVDGCEVVCLTHHWRFGTDGAGSKLNVNGRRDPKAAIQTFECVEQDGAIWANLQERAS